MIAVVPAAGRGTRLGQLTAERPKALVPVGGIPVLFRVIDGLVSAGVDRIIVVLGHLGDQVEAALSGQSWPVTVTRQDEPRGTADALMAARHHVGRQSFAYAWGDLVMSPSSYVATIEASASGPAIAVNRVADPSAGAAVTVGADGIVTSIVEKPSPGTSRTPFNAAGVGVLPAEAWDHLAAVKPSPRGELEITSAVATMISSGIVLQAVEVETVFDIGTPQGLAAAEAWLVAH
jgi:dTDP-glucose pyrophosphorylase